jgi:hypothetical protein
LVARNGPNETTQYKQREKKVILPTPNMPINLLQIGIINNEPREAKKIAPPILPSVIPILSAIYGMYITQTLNKRLKQA